MSTVRIKTEPTATATATATVDVQVKLEPSLSAGDIKLEQHSSNIDTKVESDTEADSEEDEVKSESNDESDDEDTDQHQFTITLKNQRKWVCEYTGCGLSFNSSSSLRMHRREHRLQVDFNMYGGTYILTRQSLCDRWPCPIPDCTSTAKIVHSLRSHIRRCHSNTTKQQQHEQPPPQQKTRYKLNLVDVDSFCVNGVRCGYHIASGVFICHECRLVPECLLTHLQEKHGFNEKSIDNSVLPESAVNASADPNINQHISNSFLAPAISQPHQQQHRDIVKGWLCAISDCGYCGSTAQTKGDHKRYLHPGEQLITAPALVLRLAYAKTQTTCFLITRIDKASGAVTTNSSTMKRHRIDHSHNGLDTRNESEDDASQKRQWKCDFPSCGRSFNSSSQLSVHRHDHKLEVVINVHGTTFTLSRQSSDDRWPCPAPGCDSACQTTNAIYLHIINAHSALTKQKRVNSEYENGQQPTPKRKPPTIQYRRVDDFYIGDTRYGYQTTIGVFMCHECRLVPECLLTHLQQKHGFDEKSIDCAILPESARITGSDPNTNQHTSNPLLAAAIREPYQWRNSDIVQGWLCVISDCGYCCSNKPSKYTHQNAEHKGEQQSTVPALALRLLYGKAQTSSFLITRLDTITDNSVNSTNFSSQHDGECFDVDDGDELVLSDYSD